MLVPLAVLETGRAEFDVRLTYRDLTGATGNLEIFIQGSWLMPGVSALDPGALRVVCRSLGFTKFEEGAFPIAISVSQVTVAEPRLQTITCGGNEASLDQCDSNIDTGAEDVEPALRVACPGQLYI